MRNVQILSNREIAPGSYLLSFTRFFEFIPGQVVYINYEGGQPSRLYSISSDCRDNIVKILYSVKSGGYLTPKLALAVPGDTIQVSDPLGGFICHEKEAFFIAAGTGIAPFASMIFSGMQEGKTLIHGSRNPEGLYFRDEMISLLGNSYIPCLSAGYTLGTFTGRLTQYLQSVPSLPTRLKYYLCGSAEMVVETRDILINRGISYEQIIAEIYF